MPDPKDEVLAKVDRARTLLMEARDATDVKKIVDMAKAAEVYAKRQRLSEDAIEYATSIKVEAMALMGEMLKTADMSTGSLKRGPVVPDGNHGKTRLNDLGIGKKESVAAQAMAEVRVSNPKLYAEAHTGRKSVSKVVAEVKKSQKQEARKSEMLAEACTVDDLSKLTAAGKRFGCIYADPPWAYSNQATRASTKNHYKKEEGTGKFDLSIEELCELPVRELAADESHLWLWTTNAFLFECPRLFDAWGFEFKSSYIWVKPQIGIGNYLRNAHEFLLLAVRGGLTSAARDVRSWGEFNRTEHSAKPESIRKDVVEKSSPGPYLELFGRKPAFNWTVWGNEIAKDLFDSEVRKIA